MHIKAIMDEVFFQAEQIRSEQLNYETNISSHQINDELSDIIQAPSTNVINQSNTSSIYHRFFILIKMAQKY